MSRIYITFGGRAYDSTIEKQVEYVAQHNPDVRHVVYDDKWMMEQPFYELNCEWWSKPDTKYNLKNRGFGWFIWKPFVIMHALEHAAPGDVVLYTDADTWPIADLSPIFETAERDGMMLFKSQGCWNAHYCKRDTFIVMAQDEAQWRDRDHACARFMAFRAGYWPARQLLMEWLTYSLNPLANTFDESRINDPCLDDKHLVEYSELREPRCEQAILTNLAHRYGVRLYREACQAGLSQPEDKELYGQLFVQFDCAGDKTDLSGSRWRNVE